MLWRVPKCILMDLKHCRLRKQVHGWQKHQRFSKLHNSNQDLQDQQNQLTLLYPCFISNFPELSPHLAILLHIAPQKTFVGLEGMSWRCFQHVFSVTIFRLPRRLQDVLKIFWRRLAKTSWRHLATHLEDVFKTSWKTKYCYAEDIFKMSSRRLKAIAWRDVLRTL